jgi:DNA-directed RNA polymerase subunit RPC12/RpoP
MWFWLWFSRCRKVQKGHGYFNCPHCQRREMCSFSQFEDRRYIYGLIPVSSGEPVGPEYYVCESCKREWASDLEFAFDFGTHAQTRTWKCFKCGKELPYEAFECSHCGYRLDIGGRL